MVSGREKLRLALVGLAPLTLVAAASAALGFWVLVFFSALFAVLPLLYAAYGGDVGRLSRSLKSMPDLGPRGSSLVRRLTPEWQEDETYDEFSARTLPNQIKMVGCMFGGFALLWIAFEAVLQMTSSMAAAAVGAGVIAAIALVGAVNYLPLYAELLKPKQAQ